MYLDSSRFKKMRSIDGVHTSQEVRIWNSQGFPNAIFQNPKILSVIGIRGGTTGKIYDLAFHRKGGESRTLRK
jgi:hypothetical protein